MTNISIFKWTKWTSKLLGQCLKDLRFMMSLNLNDIWHLKRLWNVISSLTIETWEALLRIVFVLWMVKKVKPFSLVHLWSTFTVSHRIEWKCGWIIGGAKGYVGPPPKLLGGGVGGWQAPPSLSSYAYASIFGPDKHTELLKICFRTLVKKIRIFLFWKLIWNEV